MGINRYKFDESLFENIDTQEKAYWLGFILADASIQIRLSGQAIIKIGLASIDREHPAKFKLFLGSEIPIKDYLSGNGKNDIKSKSSEICITSKKMVDDLAKLGLGPRKSHTVLMPTVREDLVSHLIRGIWDGDGSVLFRAPQARYPKNIRPEVQICGNINIVTSIQDILVKELNCTKTKIFPASSIFLFRYVGQTAKGIVNYLYKDSTVYLDRKMEKANNILSWESIRKNYPANRLKVVG